MKRGRQDRRRLATTRRAAAPVGVAEASSRPWEDVVLDGCAAARQEDGGKWRLGDLASEVARSSVYGERRLEKFADAIKRPYATVRDYRRVAEAFTSVERSTLLSWDHHRIVAARVDRLNWIKKVEAHGWTTDELREAIRSSEQHEPGPLPDGKFRVILADPPWPVTHAKAQYSTMTIEEICALGSQVLAAAADDAWLFMWVISEKLREAFEVLDAWGFAYQQIGTWRKLTVDGAPNASGMGRPLRIVTEHWLIGKRGNPPLLSNEATNFLEAPRRRPHSRKPDEVFDLIERTLPGPHLELFARRARPGWAAWGNQVTGDQHAPSSAGWRRTGFANGVEPRIGCDEKKPQYQRYRAREPAPLRPSQPSQPARDRRRAWLGRGRTERVPQWDKAVDSGPRSRDPAIARTGMRGGH